jgi:hypothetical protein
VAARAAGDRTLKAIHGHPGVAAAVVFRDTVRVELVWALNSGIKIQDTRFRSSVAIAAHGVLILSPKSS